MRIKSLVLVGILIIACAAMVTPVMAADSGVATIHGNPTAVIAIDIPAASQTITLTLKPGEVTTYTPVNPSITVSSNYGSWVVKATDGTPGTSNTGHMSAHDGTSYDFAKYLQNAMSISTTTTTGWTGATSDLSTGVNTIATGDGSSTATSASLSVPFAITQTVGYSDPVLPSGSNYQIIATFTGTTP